MAGFIPGGQFVRGPEIDSKILRRCAGRNSKRKDLNRPAGTCDKAVEALQATRDQDEIILQLEQIGNVQAGAASRCSFGWSRTTFTITELGNISPQAFSSELQDVFLTRKPILPGTATGLIFNRLRRQGP